MKGYVYRDELVDGLKPTESGWLWPERDTGCWDGPKENWKDFRVLIERYCKRFGVVIQAGGACGMYPYLLSKMFSVVYTFEPTISSFHCLTHNTPVDNVIKFNAALGHAHEMAAIDYKRENNVGMNTVNIDKKGIIPILMIDDLDLSSCDYIMLDTEGFEYNILLGAQHTISTFKPLVSLEDQREATRHFMINLGYKQIAKIHSDSFWLCEGINI